YDEDYEQKGIDYPLPFVRWTEKRNFEAILQAISLGRIHVEEMISEVIPLEEYQKIYGDIGQSRSIASILKYNETIQLNPSRNVQLREADFSAGKGVLGIIGAGNFTKMTMLPALKDSGAFFIYVASSGGVSGTALA